jgi:hypothetical protein
MVDSLENVVFARQGSPGAQAFGQAEALINLA